MAITTKITLDHTGLDIEIPAYISINHVNTVQVMEQKTGRVYWQLSANVQAFVSRDAKHGGKEPLEVSAVSGEFDPAESPFAAAYRMVKAIPRFAGAKDA